MRQENVPAGPPEGGVLSSVEGQTSLWEQLKQGRLVARGVKVGEGTWSLIPASAWPGLDYFYCDNGRSDAIGSNYSAIYREVTFRRSAVLEIWPAIDKTQVEPVKATSRGRKRMIDQDQIDKVVFELFDDNGDLSGDDPDWNIQAHVERSTRTVLKKKFGEKNVVKELTLRKYVKNAIEEREKRKGR